MNTKEGYNLIKDGKITEALKIFENTYRMNLDYKSECVLKVIKYLLSKERKIRELSNPHAIADSLIEEWKNIVNYMENQKCLEDIDLFESVKYHIFSLALKYYNSSEQVYVEDDSVVDIDLMVKVSKCYREIGELGKAIDLLEDVREHNQRDSYVLSTLADIYFEVGDIERSKLFFREAFFWDPQRVEVFSMKSMIIKKLRNIVYSNGYREEEINEWIPVYACIENVFDVRREITPQEVNELIERIKLLENEYLKSKQWRHLVEPRLINSYLWLVDYYGLQEEDISMARSIASIISKISPVIYNKLILGGYKWL